MRPSTTLLLLAAATAWAGCATGEMQDPGPSGDADTDADTDGDTDGDTDADADADTDADADADTDADTDGDTDGDADADADSDADIDADSDADTDGDTDGDTDADADADADSDTDADGDTCQLSAIAGAFTSGADGWTYSGNWAVQSSGGSLGGYMRFDDDPHHTGYSYALVSPAANLGGCSSATLQYSITLDDYMDDWYGYDEYIRVQCSGDGSTWTTLTSYVDGDDDDWEWDESFAWGAHAVALPAGCRATTSYIRFLGEGDDTWDIDYWGVDSVSLTP